MTEVRPYGTWVSPISAADVAAAHGSLQWVDQPDGALWWVESRPDEGGRLALFRLGDDGSDDGSVVELTPPAANVRNRVHEYGGRPWCAVPAADLLRSVEASVAAGGSPAPSRPVPAFCYTEWRDHRLWLVDDRGARPLTPSAPHEASLRYAEPVAVGDEVWALRERHLSSEPTDVVRDWVAIPLDGSAADDGARVRELGAGPEAGGHHFLAGLRVSADGRRAAWIGWDHPRMPWDGTDLVVADIVDGSLVGPCRVAGGASVAICQTEWVDDRTLAYLGDENGWWNLSTVDIESGWRTVVTDGRAELGGALWKPGLRWFAPLGDGRYGVLRDGEPCLVEHDGDVVPLAGAADAGVPKWSASITAHGGRLASVGYGPTSLPRLAVFDAGAARTVGPHHAAPVVGAASTSLDSAWLPRPELRWFEDADGVRVPAHVYPPTNPEYAGADGELPPYIVHVHGGPTGSNGIGLDLEIAYFTSRGIGVVAPEYGGSTSFGRAWRERLRGQWGIVDLADAETVARGLVADGLADPARLVVRGGSAGGFTTARAMTTAGSAFTAGLCAYPVIDLVGWATGETHDFESQYLSGLVGVLPDDEARFRERSPSDHAAEAHGPLLVLQGLDDRICPPEATERFVERIAATSHRHRYVAYPGEQHGFRMAGTVAHAIATEFEFIAAAFGIASASVEHVDPDEGVIDVHVTADSDRIGRHAAVGAFT